MMRELFHECHLLEVPSVIPSPKPMVKILFMGRKVYLMVGKAFRINYKHYSGCGC